MEQKAKGKLLIFPSHLRKVTYPLPEEKWIGLPQAQAIWNPKTKAFYVLEEGPSPTPGGGAKSRQPKRLTDEEN